MNLVREKCWHEEVRFTPRKLNVLENINKFRRNSANREKSLSVVCSSTRNVFKNKIKNIFRSLWLVPMAVKRNCEDSVLFLFFSRSPKAFCISRSMKASPGWRGNDIRRMADERNFIAQFCCVLFRDESFSDSVVGKACDWQHRVWPAFVLRSLETLKPK